MWLRTGEIAAPAASRATTPICAYTDEQRHVHTHTHTHTPTLVYVHTYIHTRRRGHGREYALPDEREMSRYVEARSHPVTENASGLRATSSAPRPDHELGCPSSGDARLLISCEGDGHRSVYQDTCRLASPRHFSRCRRSR